MKNIGKPILNQSERCGLGTMEQRRYPLEGRGFLPFRPDLYVAVPAVLQSGRSVTVEGAAPDNLSPICLAQILRFGARLKSRGSNYV
jgi:hypothetical protein